MHGNQPIIKRNRQGGRSPPTAGADENMTPQDHIPPGKQRRINPQTTQGEEQEEPEPCQLKLPYARIQKLHKKKHTAARNQDNSTNIQDTENMEHTNGN